MKLSPRSDRAPDAGLCEADSADEAIALARQSLGAHAEVRCWKVRHGGVLGFFSRESYVAGAQAPEGAGARQKSPPMRPSMTRRERTRTGVRGGRSDVSGSASTRSEEVTGLSGLIERMVDDINRDSDHDSHWGGDVAPSAVLGDESVFRDVLAEAEAALHHDDEAAYRDADESGRVVRLDPPPGWLEGLRQDLSAMGVPLEFQPPELDETLNGFLQSLTRLPSPELLRVEEGSVTVVVGTRRDALAVARHIVATHGLEESDLFISEMTSASRLKASRRRAAKRSSVLVVDASLMARNLSEVSSWIDRLRPEYVLGVVSAATKRSDVEHWRTQLGRIDALALVRLAATSTPGELLGSMPIALIDGIEASPLRWLLLLASSVLERRC